jgi:ParB-like chromosome segregation protein Spo0J
MKTQHIRPSPQISGIVEQAPSILKPWPNNPRRHSPKQIFSLKKSIAYYSFTAPVLVDDKGTILSGEARWIAAKELNLPTIPTRVISGLTRADKRAYVLADNKLALMASWDLDLLRDEIQLLIAEDFEIDLTGFSTVEIDLLIEQPAANAELEPQDVPERVVTRLGDLWTLGKHRLLCGDALPSPQWSVQEGDLRKLQGPAERLQKLHDHPGAGAVPAGRRQRRRSAQDGVALAGHGQADGRGSAARRAQGRADAGGHPGAINGAPS